jgi:hypothetical protein
MRQMGLREPFDGLSVFFNKWAEVLSHDIESGRKANLSSPLRLDLIVLGLGIAAILGGIAIVDIGYWNTLIVWSPDGAGLENVVIFSLLRCASLSAFGSSGELAMESGRFRPTGY